MASPTRQHAFPVGLRPERGRPHGAYPISAALLYIWDQLRDRPHYRQLGVNTAVDRGQWCNIGRHGCVYRFISPITNSNTGATAVIFLYGSVAGGPYTWLLVFYPVCWRHKYGRADEPRRSGM